MTEIFSLDERLRLDRLESGPPHSVTEFSVIGVIVVLILIVSPSTPGSLEASP